MRVINALGENRMEDTAEKSDEIYAQSANCLEMKKSEFNSDISSENKRAFVKLQYMVIIIYNDLCREYCDLHKNTSVGTSKILALGPVILKLFEAHLWYKKEGNKEFLALAERRGIKQDVEKKLKELKNIKSSRIELYSKYRNKLAGHYSFECISLIEELEQECEATFSEDAETVIRYGNKWLDILGYIGNRQRA